MLAIGKMKTLQKLELLALPADVETRDLLQFDELKRLSLLTLTFDYSLEPPPDKHRCLPRSITKLSTLRRLAVEYTEEFDLHDVLKLPDWLQRLPQLEVKSHTLPSDMFGSCAIYTKIW